MKRGIQGHYVVITTVGETAKAFVPAPLPPRPPVDWTPNLRAKFDQALVELGRLDSVAPMLPNTSVFLYMYIRKEAVLSSMIEGTQSSLSDLLLYELDQAPGVPLDDVREVCNYVSALEHGLRRLKDGFPLSLRLLREMHELLLDKGRGSNQTPGEFRRSQNWIGGTRPGNAVFVPPPAELVPECLGRLELFLHDQPEQTSAMLKAALAHVQFETIHPFLDGNGRLGRLLITLLLCEQKILREPLLYLSLYFKTHRQRYYELLDQVRIDGDWEAWLEFFAEAVCITATQAVATSRRLHELTTADRERLSTLGRAAESAIQIHSALLAHPVATAKLLGDKTGISPATVNKSLANLVQIGIVREITGKKRDRVFSYGGVLDIMNEGIELPSR